MKYSEFLELIYENIEDEYPFLCQVIRTVELRYTNCDEHVKKFRKYINRLLLETKKLNGTRLTLTTLLEKRYGSEMYGDGLRKMLIKDLIAYHKKRGN